MEPLSDLNPAHLWYELEVEFEQQLKKLENLPPERRRLIAFERRPYQAIQDLLTLAGKWLHRIALAYGFHSKQISFANLHLFRFYCWPSYESLYNGERVFINGPKIEGRTNQQRYLGGIGARAFSKIVELEDQARFLDYLFGNPVKGKDQGVAGLNKQLTNPHLAHHSSESWFNPLPDDRKQFIGSNSIYYSLCPSVVAFDVALNPLYFRNFDVEFRPGSTHAWRYNVAEASQISGRLQLPDKSSFEILHIYRGKKPLQSTQTGKNIVHVWLPSYERTANGSEIGYSYRIQRALNLGFFKRNIIFPFDSERKSFISHFVPWPLIAEPEKEGHSQSGLDYEYAVLKCYDLWLAATFGDHPNTMELISKELRESGFEDLSQISDVATALKQHSKLSSKQYAEVSFKHWFSIYLASGRRSDNPGH